MTTLYDIPAEILNPALAARLEESGSVSTPEWAEFVKTGADRERPPLRPTGGLFALLQFYVRLLVKAQ